MHPTCGTTLTGQPNCQYCAEPFKDVLLHKDKCLSECNHAYCAKCFNELLQLNKNCTICNEPMKYKILPCQRNSSRFSIKSKVRTSYSKHAESSQGKLKMFKVNTVSPNPVAPFPSIGDIRCDGDNVVGNYTEITSFIKPNMTNNSTVSVSPVTNENIFKYSEMDLPKYFDSGMHRSARDNVGIKLDFNSMLVDI